MLNNFEIAFNLVSLFYFLLKWKHWDTKSAGEKGLFFLEEKCYGRKII